MADLWSDYSDTLVTQIDGELAKKYKMTVRAFLTNPGDYASFDNIRNTAKNMKEDVDRLIDERIEEYAEEKKALERDASKADAITNQLSQNLSLQAKQNRIPLIKPVLIERDETSDEVVHIDSVDSGVLGMIEKLATSSQYVADYTYSYKNYKIGGWFFSGQKNYMIRVYLPDNEVLYLEGSRSELDTLFDTAITQLAYQ